MEFTIELKCHLVAFGNNDAEVKHAKIFNSLGLHFRVIPCKTMSRYSFHTFCFNIEGVPSNVVNKIEKNRELADIDYEIKIIREKVGEIA